jgi:hypothetical protein
LRQAIREQMAEANAINLDSLRRAAHEQWSNWEHTADLDSLRQAVRERIAESNSVDWDSVRQAHNERRRLLQDRLRAQREQMHRFREQMAEADTTDRDSILQAHRERMEAHRERVQAHRERMQEHHERMREHHERMEEHRERMEEHHERMREHHERMWEHHEQIREQRRVLTPYGECEQVEDGERQIHFGDGWIRPDIHAIFVSEPSDVERITWHAYNPETEERGEILRTTESIDRSCQPVPNDLEATHVVGRVYHADTETVFNAYVDNSASTPEVTFVGVE